VAHGAGSCIALPHALRFHAAATRERQAALAARLAPPADRGRGAAPGAAAPLEPVVARLLDALAVPRRLRDVGVEADALDEVVSAMRAEAPTLGTRDELLAACARML
jgi:alcohol dehydrogenase class IV